jgi:hypothetical protein
MMALKVGGWCLIIPIAAYGLFALLEDGPGGDDVDGLDTIVGMFLYLFGLPMLASGLGLSAVGLCVLIWRRLRLRRTG